MNIKGLSTTPPNDLKAQGNQQQNRVADNPEKNKAPVNPEKPGESLQLSSAAKDIRKIEQNLAQLPDVNQDRVEDIKNAINNGQYEVNSRSVAEKLLGLEKDF